MNKKRKDKKEEAKSKKEENRHKKITPVCRSFNLYATAAS
jgi:hypothetical protein